LSIAAVGDILWSRFRQCVFVHFREQIRTVLQIPIVFVRRLIFIPVIHNLADLGSLAESVRAHHVEHHGRGAWEQRERAVEKLWDDIRQAIDVLHLDYRQVRIYQDGLPLCGKEEQIVRELAGAGSVNHQFVLELMRQGAGLVGTEDPRLLIREYQLQRRRMAARDAGEEAASSSPGEEAEVLAARDLFIAQRIAATLQDHETGLLFLGAAHRLDELRASGIELQTLNCVG
jgi:hypothetical protein